MSLSCYRIDLSSLAPKERMELLGKIDRYAYMEADTTRDCGTAQFFLDKNHPLSGLPIPDSCKVIRL